ncbi:MAG: lipid-A-disaccharide synthase, partial [Burkholderiaceae bacterium]|nr:lipid-A-disaccharide synthase [Burkholderiaceae bacterium]
MTMEKKGGLAWLAGETSGDFIASLVLPEVKAMYPDEPMFGIGGDKMIAAGLDAWHHSSVLAVRGYMEVLSRLPQLLMLRKRMIADVAKAAPRAFIGVDAPDFNLGIELKLREQGMKTIHFVCPSIWAWRPERIHTIKKAVDHMLMIFPFEKELMDAAGIDSTYIGHPLARIIPMEPNKDAARERLGLDVTGPLFAVLPGSRQAEVKWCAPLFFKACETILQFAPNARFVVPAADATRRAQIQQILDQFPKTKVATTLTTGDSHSVMEASDAILVASGTATLEAALFKRPMVVGYAMPGITGILMERKGIIPWVSLPNILARKRVVPELLQYFCQPEALGFALW